MIILIITFALISSLTIGGGYAMIPLIQEEAIYIHKWITESDFMNILAISQITPGAIAVNSATYVGFKSYGLLGAILATVGLVLPSVIIIFIIAPFLKKYEKNRWRIRIFSGIRPVVTGLISAAIIIMGKTVFVSEKSLNIFAIFITIIAFLVIRFTKTKPIIILLACAVLGIFFNTLSTNII